MVGRHPRQLGARPPSSPAVQVGAISITGQWASTIPVDEAGLPTGPCMMWLDERGGPLSKALVGGPLMGYHAARLATWLRRSGAVPSTTGADPIGHMLWLERNTPANTRWYLEPVDYLAMRLTKQAAATHASMTAAWLTDNRDLSTLEYDATLVHLTGINPDRLPPLVKTGSVIGTVHPSVATELGLPADTAVITGVPDLHAATIGSGAVELGEPHISIGTTGWISAPLAKKKTDLVHMMATVPGLDNATYLLGNNQESAGRALAWYRDTLAPHLSYEELIAEAAARPAGAGGCISPWIAGERSPVKQASAWWLPQPLSRGDPGRYDPGGHGGRCLQYQVVVGAERKVRRQAIRHDQSRGRRGPIRHVVSDLGQRVGPHHREPSTAVALWNRWYGALRRNRSR